MKQSIVVLIIFTAFLAKADCPPVSALRQHEYGHWFAEDGWCGIVVREQYRAAVPISSPHIDSFYAVTINPRQVNCSYLTDVQEEVTISFKLDGKKAMPQMTSEWYPTKKDNQHWACMVNSLKSPVSICAFLIE